MRAFAGLRFEPWLCRLVKYSGGAGLIVGGAHRQLRCGREAHGRRGVGAFLKFKPGPHDVINNLRRSRRMSRTSTAGLC